MIPTEPVRPTGTRLVVAGLATLALVLAACSSANPTASPSASVNSSAGAGPSASPAPSASQVPSATQSATGSPAPANQPQTIHLIDHPTNGTDISVGSLAGCKASTCQGDYIIGYDPVVDAVTGKEVGTLAYECFLVDPGSTLYHCPGNTFTLTGRGQIVFAEVIQHEVGGPPTFAPITGGTGEFLGVTGTVASQKVSAGGDFVITITK